MIDILCRIEEMRESVKIILQCIEKLPKGPLNLLIIKFHHPIETILNNQWKL